MSKKTLPRPAKAPCKTCPYRRDVPSGVWEASEYAKLPGYDGEIFDQLTNDGRALFMCHQQDGCLCSGWLATHGTDNLLALRMHRVHPSTYGYESPVPVFSSGAEAAAHGMAGVEAPDDKARKAIDRLEKKRDRRAKA